MPNAIPRISLLLASLLAALLIGAVPPASVQAATLTVTTCDRSALLTAIDNAGVGDTVNFACSGTILGDIVISKDLTIDGSGQDVAISGGRFDQVSYPGLFVSGTANVTLKNLTFADYAGVAVATQGGTVNVLGSTFRGSSLRALSNDSGTLNISNSTFIGNGRGLGDGGAIRNFNGPLTVINSSFVGNASYRGGAIMSQYGAVTITNSTFSGNTASDGGGALYLSPGTFTVSNSTFSGNAANGPWSTGGAILFYGGDDQGTITNSTFSGNSALTGGGAIINGGGGIGITNSTFYANSTGPTGWGSAILNAGLNRYDLVDGGTLTLTNTILIDHPVLGHDGFYNLGGGCVSRGTIIDGGGNLADDGTCPFPANNNQSINLDPAGLGYNGGPTQTIALAQVSAAKGAALQNCPATDQRGAPRPARCDSGAYQSGATPPPLVGDPQPLHRCDEASLRGVIALASPGATVRFACSGTITLTSAGGGAITLGKDLTIDGSGQQVTITGAASSAFSVAPGSTVALLGFTLARSADSSIRNGGTLHVRGMIFDRNVASTGAAILNLAGTVTVTDTMFSSNQTLANGGAIVNGGTLNISGSTFSGNRAAFSSLASGGLGGAIYNTGTLNLTSSSITGNSAAVAGGVANLGQSTVTGSTFSGNTAAAHGGGGANFGQFAATNSTFSGNTAASGGGIANFDQLTVINSTIADNSATDGGSALSTQTLPNGNPAVSSVVNTILAKPLVGVNCSGAVTDQGGNLADDGSCGFTAPSSTNNAATLATTLGALAENGGPTRTIALLVGSPAIGAGVASVCNAAPVGGLDQRGFPRDSATCASGAYDTAAVQTSVSVFPLTSRGPFTGQPFTFGASVNVPRPGVNFDGSGSLSYYDGTVANPIAGCTDLSPANSRCTTSALAAGPHTILVVYSGSLHFLGSQGSVAVMVIDQPLTTTSSSPNTAKAGSAGFTVTVTGTLFNPGSVVHLDGVALVTRFDSSTQLTADVPANLTARTGLITVVNPPPSYAISNPQVLIVTLTGAQLIGAPAIASGTDPRAEVSYINGDLAASINATGTGTLVVARFASNPVAETSFGSDRYITASVLPGSDFRSATIWDCDRNGGDKLSWWNGTAWEVADRQRLGGGCLVFIASTDTAAYVTTPLVTQLGGALFAVGSSVVNVQAPVAQSVQYGSALGFNVSATSANAGSVTLQASGLPTGLGFTDNGNGTGTVSGTVTGEAKTYVATFTARDSQGDAESARVAITVTRAPLTITANDQTMPFGGAVPTFDARYSSFVNGDLSSVVSGLACGASDSGGQPVSSSTSAGTYAIVCAGAAAANYQIGYVPGTLTITGAAVQVPGAQSVQYGSTLGFTVSVGNAASGITPTLRAAGLPAGLDFTDNGNGTGTVSGTVTAAVNTYTASFTANDGQRDIASATVRIDVTKAPLTITASSPSMAYGSTPPTITPGYSGFVNGDTAAALTVAPTCTTTALSSSPVGSYPTACAGATAANYGPIGYVAGTLTVTPAQLTITAQDQRMTYGGTLPELTWTADFVNGDSLVTSPTCTTVAVSSPVGTHDITCAGASAGSNYSIAYAKGTLTIIPAQLTVIANDATRPYGAPDPAFTARFEGFKNGDNATSARIGGVPGFSTTATPTSPLGTYAIVPSLGTLNAPNYQFAPFVNGMLTVIAAPPELVQVRGDVTYGDTTGSVSATLRHTAGSPIAGMTLKLTMSGTALCGVSGKPACPVTNAQGVATLTGITFPAGLNAGNYANRVCATFAGGNGYDASGPTCGPLVVARRILWLKPQDRTVGLRQPNPATAPPANCVAQATATRACWLELTNGSSFANGESWASLNLANVRFAYNRSGNGPATERVGAQYRITVSGALSQNYDLRYQTGTLTVVAP